jgi:hypothetical protein
MAEKESDIQDIELLGVNILRGALVLAVIAIIVAALFVPSEAELISQGISPVVRYHKFAWVIVGDCIFLVVLAIICVW